MSTTTTVVSIPEDLPGCQALIAQLADTIAILKQENESQKLTINELLQRAFQRRSERYIEDPRQLKLDFGDSAEVTDAAEGLADAVAEAANTIVIPAHTRRRRVLRKRRNEQLPAHLPRYEVELPVPEDLKSCAAHGEKRVIGYDRQETLEFERPKLRVRVTLIPKLACEKSPECGVSQPARPKGLVEGHRYDTSVAAEIVTDKYGYHLPIYRQQDLFASSGWTPSRGTLLNIAQAASELLPPFIEYLRGQVLASQVIGTDDTTVTLLLPSEIPSPQAGDARSQRIFEVLSAARTAGDPSVRARIWAYRSMLVPLNVFDFTVSGHRDGPDDFLVASGFRGTMLGDCYSGYLGITLRSDSRILRAACNSHARRKLFEAHDNQPLLAAQFLALYRQLYDIEERAREMTADDRRALREQEARPLWERMRELRDSPAATTLMPKESFTQALGYLRNQWDALQMYLSDGRLPIDNNDVEQLMKQVATGRKNWLFLGSVASGVRTANFLTLVSSALRNDLDVYTYVKAVLDSLLSGSTDYASLRPDCWAAEHPEAIRVYRQEERRYRFDAKTTRRAARRQAAQIQSR